VTAQVLRNSPTVITGMLSGQGLPSPSLESSVQVTQASEPLLRLVLGSGLRLVPNLNLTRTSEVIRLVLGPGGQDLKMISESGSGELEHWHSVAGGRAHRGAANSSNCTSIRVPKRPVYRLFGPGFRVNSGSNLRPAARIRVPEFHRLAIRESDAPANSTATMRIRPAPGPAASASNARPRHPTVTLSDSLEAVHIGDGSVSLPPVRRGGV
jgi:hypothetical protein